MRRHRLLPIPSALLLALLAAAPASAVKVEITATNYEFSPSPLAIAVGDTVVWSFASGGHTTTASRGQAERWDSGSRESGRTFRHTFDRRGRFQYVCTPHAGFMKGVVTVGSDVVGDTVDAFKTTPTGSRVRVSFKLNEPATVSFKLRGA